jgi:hypothetical protein
MREAALWWRASGGKAAVRPPVRSGCGIPNGLPAGRKFVLRKLRLEMSASRGVWWLGRLVAMRNDRGSRESKRGRVACGRHPLFWAEMGAVARALVNAGAGRGDRLSAGAVLDGDGHGLWQCAVRIEGDREGAGRPRGQSRTAVVRFGEAQRVAAGRGRIDPN